MATKIDQKAYLQKYLGGSSGDKKKKKKKVVKGRGFKIIDDDLDLSKLRALDGDELDVFDEGEDAPQIAGIIDDRPEELKKLEQFKTTSKWKVINRDDGFNSNLQIQEIKKDVKEIEKENEIIFGKMYSDSEDEKKDSDASPPRKQKDFKNNKRGSDSDASPPRKRQNDSNVSPSRNVKDKSTSKRSKHSDSSIVDVSPPMKYRKDVSPLKNKQKDNSKQQKKHYDSDNSPPRRRKDDSDVSPPRKKQKDNHTSSSKRYQNDSNASRNKEKRTGYDSDLSPPRKNSNKVRERKKPSRWGDADDTIKNGSPVYKQHKSRSKSPNKSNNKPNYDSDLSPPRKSRKDSPKRAEKSNKHEKNKHRSQNSDSDLSPPRKRKSVSPRNNRDRYNNSDSPPPTNKKMARTLEGKMAGLQNAVQLREENQQFRRKEEEAFKRMTDEVSGRNAQVVSRKGKRETSEDRQKQREKAERQKEIDEKYKKWSKGIKQIEAQEARVREFMHEAAKPLARHKDDRDLETHLRDVERAGDPMLQYIREKKRERGELPPEKPSYKGSFPPNRFGIRPGYRWDGVDRSNGYEKKYFDSQSKRRAQEEEAYKWSTEDL